MNSNFLEDIREDETGFDHIVDMRLASCKKVLLQKKKEYSSETDRFHNFKFAAKMLGLENEAALQGMWVKHLVSVFDIIENPDDVTIKIINEKITDNINYLLLLEGLLLERIAKMPTKSAVPQKKKTADKKDQYSAINRLMNGTYSVPGSITNHCLADKCQDPSDNIGVL